MATLTSQSQNGDRVQWTTEWALDENRMKREQVLWVAPVPWTVNECAVFFHEMSEAWRQLTNIRESAMKTSKTVFLATKVSWRSMQRVMAIINELEAWYGGRGPLVLFSRIRDQLRYHVEVIHESFWSDLIETGQLAGLDPISKDMWGAQFDSVQKKLDKCYVKLHTLPPESIVRCLGLAIRTGEGDMALSIQYTKAHVESKVGEATFDVQTSPIFELSCTHIAQTEDQSTLEDDDESLFMMTQVLGRLPESTRSQFTSILVEVSLVPGSLAG